MLVIWAHILIYETIIDDFRSLVYTRLILRTITFFIFTCK